MLPLFFVNMLKEGLVNFLRKFCSLIKLFHLFHCHFYAYIWKLEKLSCVFNLSKSHEAISLFLIITLQRSVNYRITVEVAALLKHYLYYWQSSNNISISEFLSSPFFFNSSSLTNDSYLKGFLMLYPSNSNRPFEE